MTTSSGIRLIDLPQKKTLVILRRSYSLLQAELWTLICQRKHKQMRLDHLSD